MHIPIHHPKQTKYSDSLKYQGSNFKNETRKWARPDLPDSPSYSHEPTLKQKPFPHKNIATIQKIKSIKDRSSNGRKGEKEAIFTREIPEIEKDRWVSKLHSNLLRTKENNLKAFYFWDFRLFNYLDAIALSSILFI